MEKNAADVLEEAADILLIGGRVCRNPSMTGMNCVMTAIFGAGAPEPVRMVAVDALHAHLVACGVRPDPRSRNHLAAQWNDKTTDDFEVIDTLRHVAKDLRAKADPS